jgi:hypothetical protein
MSNFHIPPLQQNGNQTIAQSSPFPIVMEQELGNYSIFTAHHYKVRELDVYLIITACHHEGGGLKVSLI